MASVLARYAPRYIASLLDPAVGKGSLLVPFSRRKRQPKRITCIDCDNRVANQLHAELKTNLRSKLNFVRSNFFAWAKLRTARNARFDCIVVNPPFCGRKRVSVWHAVDDCGEGKIERAPLELAFLVQCVELLGCSGRLLAVLPSSAITCSSTRWFREFLLNSGSINCVHEIPPNTFRGVEGRIFLLVFDKNRRRETVTLCNSDLFRPQKIRLTIPTLDADLRLDYSFHKAIRKPKPTVFAASCSKRFGIKWVALTKLADILRGNVEAPFKDKVLHTTDRNGCFWISTATMKSSDTGRVSAIAHDVLVSRVGRECASSVGLYCGNKPVTVSDCVLIIRPKLPCEASQLLFAVRVLLKRATTSALIERGTGASYITLRALSSLEVPSNLHNVFPLEFESYKRAIRARRTNLMLDVELAVATTIGLRRG